MKITPLRSASVRHSISHSLCLRDCFKSSRLSPEERSSRTRGWRLSVALLFFGALHLPQVYGEEQRQALRAIQDTWNSLMPSFVGSNTLSDLEVLNGNPIQIRFNLSRPGDRKSFRVVCQHDGVRSNEINIVSTSRGCSVFEVIAQNQSRMLSRLDAQSVLGNPYFLTDEDIFYQVLSNHSTRVRSSQGSIDAKCDSGPSCSRLVQFLSQRSARPTQSAPQPPPPTRRLTGGVVSPRITWRCPRGASASQERCVSVSDRYLTSCREQGLPSRQIACVPSQDGNHWFCSWDASRCYLTNQTECLEGDMQVPLPRHRDYHVTGQQTPQGVLVEGAARLCLKGTRPVNARP